MAGEVELLFLGTGAADWQGPAESGEERKFASLLLDRRILFDCGPTALAGMAGLTVDPTGIEAVFITHSHSDHFDQAALAGLAGLRQQKGLPSLQVFLEKSWLDQLNLPGAELFGLAVEESVQIFGCMITPLAANHTGSFAAETPLHFLIQAGQKKILYATDGAWLLTRTWRFLQDHELDLAIFDCTMGPGFAADWRIFEHNSLSMIKAMAAAMLANDVLKKSAPVILTHLARTLHPDHAELVRLLEPPFLAAFDGFSLGL